MGMFASTMAGGMLVAGPPDVCKVPAPPAPPVPTPFPNMAQCATALGTTTKVLVMNMPALVEESKTPMSQGDEAGVAGGVVSGMNMGPVVAKMGSSKVKFQGKGAFYVTGMTSHNGSNANAPLGNQVSPSQTKVMVGP